jgi:DNA-binding NarL/FixJ family response regulator
MMAIPSSVDRLRRVTGASVLVVEDHDLLAQTLQVALAAEGLEVEVAPLGTDEALVAVAHDRRPDVVLLDLDLGHEHAGGEALVPRLVELGCAVVVVTGSSDDLRLGTTLELGAAGVLAKSRPFEDLLACRASAAAQRRPVMRDGDRQDLLARARRRRQEVQERLHPFQALTPRERDVLELLMQGRNADAVARHFVVSEATVRTQIRGILTKLGVGSQLAAVAEAYRVGWTAA